MARKITDIKNIQELHQITNSFPVWPWDIVSIRKFIMAFTIPILVPALTLVVKEFILTSSG